MLNWTSGTDLNKKSLCCIFFGTPCKHWWLRIQAANTGSESLQSLWVCTSVLHGPHTHALDREWSQKQISSFKDPNIRSEPLHCLSFSILEYPTRNPVLLPLDWIRQTVKKTASKHLPSWFYRFTTVDPLLETSTKFLEILTCLRYIYWLCMLHFHPIRHWVRWMDFPKNQWTT